MIRKFQYNIHNSGWECSDQPVLILKCKQITSSIIRVSSTSLPLHLQSVLASKMWTFVLEDKSNIFSENNVRLLFTLFHFLFLDQYEQTDQVFNYHGQLGLRQTTDFLWMFSRAVNHSSSVIEVIQDPHTNGMTCKAFYGYYPLK